MMKRYQSLLPATRPQATPPAVKGALKLQSTHFFRKPLRQLQIQMKLRVDPTTRVLPAGKRLGSLQF
jgi:hypothetical protein